jgi:hypothetical protein
MVEGYSTQADRKDKTKTGIAKITDVFLLFLRSVVGFPLTSLQVRLVL